MSIHASAWGWEQSVKNSTHRLVLIALCDNAAGPDAECPGLCWPSNSSIATRCLISERQVKRVIEDLAESGLVVKHRRRRRPDGTLSVWEYIIPFTRGHQRHLDTPDQGTLVTEPGDTQGHNQGTPMSPQEPSCEPSSEHVTSLVVPSETTTIEEQFNAWYQTYPKKQGKAAAFKKFKRLPKHERQACADAQPAWNAHWSREGNQFCPMASTWMNQQRWHDDLPSTNTTNTTEQTATQRLREMMNQ